MTLFDFQEADLVQGNSSVCPLYASHVYILLCCFLVLVYYLFQRLSWESQTEASNLTCMFLRRQIAGAQSDSRRIARVSSLCILQFQEVDVLSGLYRGGAGGHGRVKLPLSTSCCLVTMQLLFMFSKACMLIAFMQSALHRVWPLVG